jgi:FtsZ-binding cell division protein ZapB
MESSSQNPSRPRLGTVLSRRNWEDRRSNSTTSSVTSHASVGGTTGGSFDPENEALVSTGPVHHSPAMKNSQKDPLHDGYHIDMKATKASFSEGSESGSDADISVEIGRGGRHGQRAMEDSRNDDSIHSSNAMIGDYKVMYSPPLSAHRPPSKTGNIDQARNLRQDAQIRLASMASQKENRDPAPQAFRSFKSSDASTKVRRKTLGELNARASEMYDGSLLNDDRPVQAAPATKTTRFSRSKRDASSQLKANSTNTATDMMDINQSYALPELPNLSQLVSGTIQERTPGRVRPAAHPAFSQTPRGPIHKLVDAVPIPDDEKAIFLALNMLQGKVKELEAARKEFQKTIEELKTKNLVLKAEKRDLKTDNDRLRKENLELRTGHGQSSQAHQAQHHIKQHQEQISPPKRRQANASMQVNSEVSRITKHRQEEDLFSLTPTESIKLQHPHIESSAKWRFTELETWQESRD